MTGPRRALAGALVAIVVIVLVLNSCGGKSRLSAPALRRDATRVCTISGKRANEIKLPKSSKGAPLFLARGLAALEPELAALRLLNPPDAAAPTYNGALAALAQEQAAMRRAVAEMGVGSDTISVFRTLQAQLAPLETRANEAFQELSLDACILR